jgi:choline dehydrogenase
LVQIYQTPDNILSLNLEIDVLLDQPHVGQNLHDHILMPTVWKVKSKSAVSASKVDGFSRKIDLIATVSVPKAAIAQDSGAEPSADHAMLRQERATVSHSLQYSGPPGTPEDGSLVLMMAVLLITTSRESVGIASPRIQDAPRIDPKYLATERDRYIAREALRFEAKLLAGDATVLGRDILDGELVMPGQKALTPESSDKEIDERVKMSAGWVAFLFLGIH